MSDEHSGHFIIPVKYYVITLVALLILTVVTVAVAQVDLGALNIYVAMAVASVKAAFVILFFIGVNWEEGFNKVVIYGTFLFVALFLSITLFDVFTRDQVFKNEGEAFNINSPVRVISNYDSNGHHSEKH